VGGEDPGRARRQHRGAPVGGRSRGQQSQLTGDAGVVTRSEVEHLVRQESGRVLATLIRMIGDFDLAEESLQEALIVALERWPADGIPTSRAGWITTTARNRALDRIRREAKRGDKHVRAQALLEAERADADEYGNETGNRMLWDDDRLRLIFTCCHPALASDAQVALTLRTVAGLTTAEISHAFLVPEATMAQRLVRAKRKIRHAGIPYRVPPPEIRAERLGPVLHVIYLVFNEGYYATSGDALVRGELCNEAIRLARLVHELLPGEPEVEGLLGLLLLVDARRAARVDPTGDLVLLADQDRTRWDRDEITEGIRLVNTALGRGRPGPYQLQAAMAAVHSEAPTAEQTDWRGILALYDALRDMAPGPVVELNRAVAVMMVDGPEAALSVIDELPTEDLIGFRLFHATRADLLRRLDRRAEAAVSYRRALDLAATSPERTFLRRRLAEVED
jgi:RNA polymerase sigma-70 factor (ECF subfamily)